ncbi:unnamed protein product [Gongylonema pulchrum]|uniref:Glutathione peroxidase n=1 Tax=Gongylonema pulchrum TaxID=637853 RepID=A0A183E3Q6_9BILA|nr:unnamed protein product [Gongylonema pulchrum]
MEEPRTMEEAQTMEEEHRTVHDFSVRGIDGSSVKMDKYRGKPLIIVNIPSERGLISTNYNKLKEVHDLYKDRGLAIAAFPCSHFQSQMYLLGEKAWEKAKLICLFIGNLFFLRLEKLEVYSFRCFLTQYLNGTVFYGCSRQ